MRPVFAVVVGDEGGTVAIELHGPDGVLTAEQADAVCAAVGEKLIEFGILEARAAA